MQDGQLWETAALKTVVCPDTEGRDTLDFQRTEIVFLPERLGFFENFPEIVIGKRRRKSKAHPVPGFIEHRVDIDPLGEKRDPDRPEHITVESKWIGTGCVQGIIRKYQFL